MKEKCPFLIISSLQSVLLIGTILGMGVGGGEGGERLPIEYDMLER